MIVAIVGRIASGKSTVMKFLQKRGFALIHGDFVVTELYDRGGAGAKLIEKNFGKEFLRKDGRVNRIRLRNLVFNDKDKLDFLVSFTYPLIEKEIKKKLRGFKGKNVVIEAVILTDNLLKITDKVIWVERLRSEILKSLVKERKFSPELAKKTINLIKKPKRVDFILRNTDKKDKLFADILNLFKRWNLKP